MYDVGSTSPFLGVPQAHPFWRDVSVDQGGDGGSEGFQLIRTNPDQEPAVILDTSRKSGAETSTSADTNAPLVDGGCV